MDGNLMTGVIQTGENPVVFSAKKDSYNFSFITDSVYTFDGSNQSVVLNTNDGFICGRTHGGHNIAIYTGGSTFEIFGSQNIIAAAYIESNTNLVDTPISSFRAIQFCGGSLNRVFHANAIKSDYGNGKINISVNDDSREYIISIEGIDVKLVVRSSISEHYGVHGSAIVNETVELTLEFPTPQPLIKLFDHYNRMIDLLSFMTFRENVSFDSICLMDNHPEYQVLSKTANVYIRQDTERTEKDFFTSITFEDLGEALPALVQLFYNIKDKAPSISLGFLRKNDNDHTMTNVKIRAICSALECELNYIPDLKAEENKELEELKDTVRETVTSFRKDHSTLSNDTYNAVLSSIGNWSFPLAEKLCALYKKYLREMLLLNQTRKPITEASIRAFVKYRNDITHGRHRTLDIEVATTAFYLGGLVYCCVLDRVGLERRKIYDLCSLKILS